MALPRDFGESGPRIVPRFDFVGTEAAEPPRTPTWLEQAVRQVRRRPARTLLLAFGVGYLLTRLLRRR